MNETIHLIHNRMSLRRYCKRPLREEHVDAILEGAMRAPTAGNMMLYTILQVADASKKAALADACGHAFIGDAPLVLLFLADMQRWQDVYEAAGVPESCERSGHPFQTPDMGKLLLGCCDALLAAHTSVLVAESLGIGSCYVGDVMGLSGQHRSLFGLPPWAFPITMVCYGYYPEELQRSRTPRFARRFICCQDRYRRLSEAEQAEMLSDVEAKFADVLRKRGMNLGEMTYSHFSAGPAARALAAAAARQIEPWGNPRHHEPD